MAYRSHSLRLSFCHQIKRSNANVGMDADALCQEGFGRAAQIVFPIPDVVAIAARRDVAPRGHEHARFQTWAQRIFREMNHCDIAGQWLKDLRHS